MLRILPHRNKKLNITLGPEATKILVNICEADGNSPESLVFDAIRELIEKRWDFKRRRPKKNRNNGYV